MTKEVSDMVQTGEKRALTPFPYWEVVDNLVNAWYNRCMMYWKDQDDERITSWDYGVVGSRLDSLYNVSSFYGISSTTSLSWLAENLTDRDELDLLRDVVKVALRENTPICEFKMLVGIIKEEVHESV